MDIEELEEEISILKKRVAVLERKENNRKIIKYIKTLFSIVIICLLCFGVWKGYEYVTKEIPNYVNNKIKELNPLNKE